jgi:hypothetical protein
MIKMTGDNIDGGNEADKQMTPRRQPPMIKISVEDFARTHRALIRLLKIIAEASEDDEDDYDKGGGGSSGNNGGGIPTLKLMKKMGTVGYAELLIKYAESLKYIRREKRKPANGVGFASVYNILTPKGRKLLAQLDVEKK